MLQIEIDDVLPVFFTTYFILTDKHHESEQRYRDYRHAPPVCGDSVVAGFPIICEICVAEHLLNVLDFAILCGRSFLYGLIV